MLSGLIRRERNARQTGAG